MKQFYRKLSDPMNAKSLINSLKKSARQLTKGCIGAKSSTFMVRLKGGKLAQVFVEVSEFSDDLLETEPMSGGLLINQKL
jgi:hypothetical protein